MLQKRAKKHSLHHAQEQQFTARFKARRKRKVISFLKRPAVLVCFAIAVVGAGWLVYMSAGIWQQNTAVANSQETTKPAKPAPAPAKDTPTTPPDTQNQKPQPPAIKNTDCSVKKCIALTFDDGPSPESDQLLDTLKQHNAKATFFYIGHQIPARSAELQRARDDGHELGIHTWDHVNLATVDPTTISSQITRTRAAIKDAAKVNAVLVRPPYGAYTQAALDQINLPLVVWNIDPQDWHYTDATILRDSILQSAKPGAIVLSHSVYQSTVDAYKDIIPALMQQGYTLVTVSDLLDIDPDKPGAGVYFKQLNT